MPPVTASPVHPSSGGLLSAAKRFGRYKSEEEHAVRAPHFKGSKGFERISRAFGEFLFRSGVGCTDIDSIYNHALGLAKQRRYSSKDVERFSAMLLEIN